MNKLIELKDINAGYDGKTVLSEASCNVYKNDFLGIIGPNGGGKTTLLKVILGLLKPFSGSISFFKDEQKVSSINIGYLPQINQIDKDFPISVYQVVASGLAAEKKPIFGFTTEQKVRIDEIIQQMGLEHLAKKAIGDLSGGERQRTLLGRAIISKPQVLVLDEPNTYVDKRFEARLYQLLEIINRDTAIILVSHDITAVLSLVKNVLCVNKSAHYHASPDISEEWLTNVYQCPY